MAVAIRLGQRIPKTTRRYDRSRNQLNCHDTYAIAPAARRRQLTLVTTQPPPKAAVISFDISRRCCL